MKLLSILALSLALVSCGKKAEFDGRSTPNDPVGSDPVTLDAQYKRTETLTASITYNTSAKTVTENAPAPLSTRGEGFKIPQELKVTGGWASHSTKSTITIYSDTSSIVCTYTSKATMSVYTDNTEYNKGLTYVWTNCSDNTVDPTVVVDGFDRIELNVNSASNNIIKTTVEAIVKIYE